MWGWFSAEAARASCDRSGASRSGSPTRCSGRTLIATVAAQLAVVGAVDLAHAAAAEQRPDAEAADRGAGERTG